MSPKDQEVEYYRYFFKENLKVKDVYFYYLNNNNNKNIYILNTRILVIHFENNLNNSSSK